MRIQLVTTVFAFALTACGDDPGGEETTTGPATTSTNTNTDSDPSASGTTSDGSTTLPGTSSSGDPTSTTSESTSAADESSSSTGEPVAFELFSAAFEEGGGIPGIHHVNGGNESPPLAWVGAPAATQSFAVFFHDISIDFEHSAIWNIPADVTELPQDIDLVPMPPEVPGAVQCESWIDEYGYGGPGSAANFYMFTLYALDVETIPPEEIDQFSSLIAVRAAFEAHAIATATLTGQSTGP